MRRLALSCFALAGLLATYSIFADGTGGTAPKLTVTATAPGQFFASWPAYLAQSYRLQATADLALGPWTDVPDTPALNGANFQVTVNSVAPQLFFRLRCDCTVGVPDFPDGSFADINCDGIDGVLTAAIFVAPTGFDNSARGLTPDNPVQTIQFALNQAGTNARSQIYVQAGTYSGPITLLNGISIYGGYDVNWIRADRALSGHTVTITGGFVTAEGQSFCILAKNLATNTTVADVVIAAPNAPPFHGSYGIVSISSNLVLARITVNSGNGGSGATGGAGGDASPATATPAMAGGSGGPAAEFSVSCDSTSRGAAGPAGTNSTVGTNGGAGGAGGTMDTDCGIFSTNFTATAGLTGTNADTVSGTFGQAGPGSPPNANQAGISGMPGRILNGAAGSGGGGISLVGNYLAGNAGSGGGVGSFGGGGGGGGGSGGDDNGTDSYGAGGGGAGGGGAPAPFGANGGTGGGPSIGIYALNSTITVSDCTIVRGTGGNGGAGGSGGRGQSGGLGGPGGAGAGGSQVGGNGGNGAHGGHGGGGGAGGFSTGIVLHGSSQTITNTTYSGGAAGTGGAGGLSATGAPVAERDGNDGGAGTNGSLATVVSF